MNSVLPELLALHGYGAYAHEKYNPEFYRYAIDEVCPHCDSEVELLSKFKVQKCPECGRQIKPCSLCIMDKVKCCFCPIGRVEK